jgi:Tfp pilus assembly protein PilF
MGGAVNRIEILRGFLENDPRDSFSRYALALEYVKLGQTDNARREFEFVRDQDPGYVATYFQLAQLYRNLGLNHEAEKTYRTGITVAAKAGDAHTQSELEGALESLLMES